MKKSEFTKLTKDIKKAIQTELAKLDKKELQHIVVEMEIRRE